MLRIELELKRRRVIKYSVITPVALGRKKLYKTGCRNDWGYRKNVEMKLQ
jgi:hypothetical protein